MSGDKGQFKKGHSGNPAGKSAGARHKATRAALALLDGDAQALSRTALRLCLERIILHHERTCSAWR
jgi:hypothetical protein